MNFYSVLAVLLLSPSLHLCSGKLQDGAFSLSDDSEFAAIKTIHKQLDNNADGSVDFRESEEFVMTELCDPGKEGAEKNIVCTESEKSLKFHQMDTEITSTELWVTWHQNEVFNWTNEDVLDWLEHSVELPQYASTFKHLQITGRQLPYIAINSGQILQNILFITDSQHKQKIQLRAMDIVLFGPPVHRGHWKDAILVVSVILCVCGVVYALRQRMLSKSHMDSFMADLKLKEEEVKRLKSRFEELDLPPTEVTDGRDNREEEEDSQIMMVAPATVSPGSTGSEEDCQLSFSCKNCSRDPDLALSQAQERIELLQQRVWSLESELEGKGAVLQMLQELLPDCHLKEREHLEFRKSLGEDQIARAQRACEKIRKRRSSLFGTFHLANSSTLEEAGLQITKAVNKMQFISECFEEHHKRWSKIGQITGLPHSPRETKSLGIEQSRHSSFSIPPRSLMRKSSEVSLSSYTHQSISSNMRSRQNSLPSGTSPYVLTRGLNNSSSISSDGRNSLQLDSLVHNQLPSLKEPVTMDQHARAFSADGDSIFSSISSSTQSRVSSLPHSSIGSHSNSGSRSSIGSRSSSSYQPCRLMSEEGKDVEDSRHQEDTSRSLTKKTVLKMRSKEKKPKIDSLLEMKDSSSDSLEECSANSSPRVTSSVIRSRNKVYSSDV